MGSSCGCSMMNNTAVFDAMLVDVFTGVPDWTRQTGRARAIHRDGYVINPLSLRYCPHEWNEQARLCRS